MCSSDLGVAADTVTNVLLHELGHAIDQRLNAGVDSALEEGRAFVEAIQGQPITDVAQTQNDSGLVNVDGTQVAVEFAATGAVASTTLGATTNSTLLNAATASAIAVTVTYNGLVNNGADILIGAYNGSTLIGWTIYNRSTNLDAGANTATATIALTFNLGQFNQEFSSNGLTLVAYQGTSGAGTGTANDTTPATTSGTSSTAVPFAVNTTTAPSAAQSFPTTGGGTATWSNVTLDLTAPGAPSITSVTDNVGSITGGLTSGGRTDDTNLTVRVSLGSTNAVAGDTVQLYNGEIGRAHV